ncbi:Protein of unknown function [Gryllus bimaculatus]|nr:Protein of unknown function [Gryllus bimaculatus]
MDVIGSSAVEHVATASAADAYSILIFFTHVRCHQVFMDISHDPCTSGQVLEVILGDESAPSVSDPFPEMASEACLLDPTSLTLSGFKLMFTLKSQNSER